MAVSWNEWQGTRAYRLTNRALRVARVTTSPNANLDHHRRLGVLVIFGIFWSEGTDSLTINLPDDLFAGPVNGIGVKFVVVSIVVVGGSAVVGPRVALSKIVGLDIEIVDPKPFPVNFIQVV